MIKKIIFIVLVSLLLTGLNGYANAKCIKVKTTELTCADRTIYVDDDNTQGPWDGTIDNPFQYIQDGIKTAENSDIIYVFSGNYIVTDKNDIVIDKQISIKGENKDTTIITASGFDDYVIKINFDYVTISNLTAKNAIRGIVCNSNFCNIIDNIITDNFDGILLSSASYNTISKNNIIDNLNGITLDDSSKNNNISLNDVIENLRGIEFIKKCNENIIFKNNVIKNSETAILIRSDYNIIINNTIRKNSYGIFGAGISLQKASHNKIIGNIISENNDDGIVLTASSKYNIIYENNIIDNVHNIDGSWFGIYIVDSSDNNIIFHNNFINNKGPVLSRNAFDNCNNIWYNSTLKEGNYWDDYIGTDIDNNGIGDSPNQIFGGSNKDLYPLMKPYNEKTKARSSNKSNLNPFQKYFEQFVIIKKLLLILI